jgi:hypothetical protein
MLNDKIRKKKPIRQKIKENVGPHEHFILVTPVIRLKISHMEKQ